MNELELDKHLSSNQLNLLSKTLKLNDKNLDDDSYKFKSNKNIISIPGLAEEIDLTPSFHPKILREDNKEEVKRMFTIWKQHEALYGLNSFPNVFYKFVEENSNSLEEKQILLRPSELRSKLLNKKAIIIQAAFRGALCRRNTLKEFETALRQIETPA
eukprot:snap_masked-scaffold_11-processed-gene-12.34-mRNA-1 protein AED:1.00 eAED:1.00 QI:0/-1/0/0/-1/1/1/0/157